MAIQRHGGMPRQCGADGDSICGAGLREHRRAGSTCCAVLESIERARVMCVRRESCDAGTVRRLLDPTPHHTAYNQFVLYSGFQDTPPDNTAGTSAKSPAVREGYLGMFRRLFNTRPWVERDATRRLLGSVDGVWKGGG